MKKVTIEEMPQGCVLHSEGKTIVISSFEDADAIIESLQRMKAAQKSTTCSCATFIPCHIEGKLVCADCKKPPLKTALRNSVT